ncbi:lactonase family protein [Legionella spiritensis]|uniref:Transmembrane protein n=1 Tax=Legionella spiritensis TaxID=452 RepID=A0A0W0Z581_LEGSP|nr:YncE family protein [Legionella spiritensis]KTD64299.1 transmembrane protein [Legionella spiritensis]SNV46792.1 transmembrane protein [Legionella spiritensis]
MKRPSGSILALVTGLLMLSSSIIKASKPLFDIVPVPGSITSLLLPVNFMETVQYQVTNQSRITRTLTMKAIQGASQITNGAGDCSNPFILAPGQTCTLTLLVNGSQVPSSGISGGPVVCKTIGPTNPNPDPLLCYQPSQQNTLAVSTTTAGQFAYVANQFNSTISFCQANPATGFLTRCTVTAGGLGAPEAIAFNPAGTLFYAGNTSTNSISICRVNQSTGALYGCADAGGAGFDFPTGIAFSPDGTIIYTSNLGGAGVISCLVDGTTGQLSACINNLSVTFAAPSDMAVNSLGTLAYIANRLTSTVSVCRVSGQMVHACDNSSGSNFDAPEGITLSPTGRHAYIANAGNRKIIVCGIREDGTGFLDNCSATDGPFEGTGSVGFNSSGQVAYVPNQITNQVFICNTTPPNGELSQCKPSLGMGFIGPAGIVLR